MALSHVSHPPWLRPVGVRTSYKHFSNISWTTWALDPITNPFLGPSSWLHPASELLWGLLQWLWMTRLSACSGQVRDTRKDWLDWLWGEGRQAWDRGRSKGAVSGSVTGWQKSREHLERHLLYRWDEPHALWPLFCRLQGKRSCLWSVSWENALRYNVNSTLQDGNPLPHIKHVWSSPALIRHSP